MRRAEFGLAAWVRCLCLFSLLGLAGSAFADAGPSEAEKAVFMAPHLAGIKAPTTLRYAYEETAAEAPPVHDSADLTVDQDGPDAYRVSARFLSGERQLSLPVVSAATANPVVLYFLENDVRKMHADLGGSTNYFRRRIRLAFAESAKVAPVHFVLDGKAHDGTRVRIEPFRGDPEAARMKGQDLKYYDFTFSPTVPGGVFDLRAAVPAADGQSVHETSLTLNAGGS